MALGLIDDKILKNIANAIRLKTKTLQEYKPSEMAQAIESISGEDGAILKVYYADAVFKQLEKTVYNKEE